MTLHRLRATTTYLLKCPYRQNFYFLLWFYISPNELLRKKNAISIKCNLFRSFKNLEICRHLGPPFAPVFPWFGMIRNTWLQANLFRLFYLCKLNLVVHTKCWKGAFCNDCEARFTEVKQTREVKPEVTCSLIYVTNLSTLMMWSAARVDRHKIGFSGFKSS